MVEKVISGGQTGVDQAGLHAAEVVGLETGGWAPKGWKTLEGPRPSLGTRWGLKEFPRGGYRERTWQNVEDSDVTLQIAYNLFSPGERCTTKAARVIFSKPLVVVDLREELPEPWRLAEEILYWNPKVLNVAGNSEQTAPGIFSVAKSYLIPVFELLRKKN